MIINGIKVHDTKDCEPPCPFHAPSDHPLKDAEIHLRPDKGYLVERICEHGIGHDDPDSVAYMQRHGYTWAGVHGCDGCCAIDTTQQTELDGYITHSPACDFTYSVAGGETFRCNCSTGEEAKAAITAHIRRAEVAAVIEELKNLLTEQQACYDCAHDNQDLETIPFVSSEIISDRIDQLKGADK